jgi:hypothetical protein
MSVTQVDMQHPMICYHCNQNIILPNSAKKSLRSMCCLRDADMDEHFFFSVPSERGSVGDHVRLESVGLPAHSMTQDGQLQAIKRLFSSCSVASISKAAYLNISKEHYVYLLSDMHSRAMLLLGRNPPLRCKDDVLQKY